MKCRVLAALACLVLVLSGCGGDGGGGGGGGDSKPVSFSQEALASPVDGASRYVLYLPQGYETSPDKRWPLLIFLHGSVVLSDLELDSITRIGVMGFMRNTGTHFPAIIIAPQQDLDFYQYPTNAQWPITWHDPVFLDAVIRDVESRYRVDKTRVSITGGSMGGFGSWAMALSFPKRFSAVMPVAGGLTNDDLLYFSNIPLTGAEDWGHAFDAVASNTVRVYSGLSDNNVPIAVARNPVSLLRSAGGNPDVHEEAMDHAGVQLLAFTKDPVDWMLARDRPDADSASTPIPNPQEFAGAYHFETGEKVSISATERQIRLDFGPGRNPMPFLYIRDDRFIAGWLMYARRDSAGNVKCFVSPLPAVKVPYRFYPDLIRDDATEACRA